MYRLGSGESSTPISASSSVLVEKGGDVALGVSVSDGVVCVVGFLRSGGGDGGGVWWWWWFLLVPCRRFLAVVRSFMFHIYRCGGRKKTS